MQSSSNVRLAYNIVRIMCMIINIGGIMMLILEPLKFEQWLPVLGAGIFCYLLVRQVRKGEGQWENTIELPKWRKKK